MQLSAVRIFVQDLQVAAKFYQHVLGLHLTHDGSAHGYFTFESAGMTIVLERVEPTADADEQALVGRFSGLSFKVADIGAEHTRLRGLGVVFSGAPEKQFWGGSIATFVDPAGNELQLVEYPR